VKIGDAPVFNPGDEIVWVRADDYDKARAEIERLRAKVAAVIAHLDDVDAGTTHWEGCEDVHPRCALRRVLDDTGGRDD